MDEILFFIVTLFLSQGVLLALVFLDDVSRAYYEPLPQHVILISYIVIAVAFIVFVCLAVIYVKKKKKIGVLYIPAWINTIGLYWLAIDSFDYITIPDPLPNYEALGMIVLCVYLHIISIIVYIVVWGIRKIINHHKSK